MKKLIFILLGFFAVFTYISAFSDAESAESKENKQEIPVEIVQ